MIRAAHRLDSLPEYVFAALGAKLKALEAQGFTIIRLDMGSPDGPPADFIIAALAQTAAASTSHGYMGFTGTPRLRQAIVDYYDSRFGVSLDVGTEVLPLIGSKEGIANMALAWLDPGDLALVPDPGYPAYRMGAFLAGADVHYFPLDEAHHFLPDLDAIPENVASRARLLWLNYPNNPTGAVAPPEIFERAVGFCRKYEILLCHDVPYADVCFDGYRAPSLLGIAGAKDVAVEFNSLSKSHNMAGWRIGMAVGNRTALRALLQVKSNVDSGIFLPVQEAATAALTMDQDWIQARNHEYQTRRDLLHHLVTDRWGLTCAKPVAGLYLWVRVPQGYSSAEFTDKVLLETGVSMTPGSAFGPRGEGYFRISIGTSTAKINEAVQRLQALQF
jgi:LL-diaminopimelate aminotransferase